MKNSKVTNFNETFIWITEHNRDTIDVIENKYTHRRNELRAYKKDIELIIFYTHSGYDEIRVYNETIKYFEQNKDKFKDYIEIDFNRDLNCFVYKNKDEVNKNSTYKDRWERMEICLK